METHLTTLSLSGRKSVWIPKPVVVMTSQLLHTWNVLMSERTMLLVVKEMVIMDFFILLIVISG